MRLAHGAPGSGYECEIPSKSAVAAQCGGLGGLLVRVLARHQSSGILAKGQTWNG